jgi:probable HAF family extracellular repeat protein
LVGLAAAIVFLSQWGGRAHARPEPAAPRYAILDVGTLPVCSESRAYGVNDKGHVVGHGEMFKEDPVTGKKSRTRVFQAFLRTDAEMVDLALPAVQVSKNGAWGINNAGQIVGRCKGRAFVWQAGTITYLGALARGIHLTSCAYDVNGKGQVVGKAEIRRHVEHAFLWQKGKMTDLGTLPRFAISRAHAINNKGQVVGEASTGIAPSPRTVLRAFLWHDGGMKNLGTLGGRSSSAAAVNDRGWIVGWADRPEAPQERHTRRAVIWKGGRAVDLGAFPGYGNAYIARHEGGRGGRGYVATRATAINDRGQIVGRADTKVGCVISRHAFLWEGGRMWDLNKLIPPGSKWRLMEANGINDRGQIVGSGLHERKTRAFLLSPMPRTSD